MEFKKQQLANGLTVIAECNPESCTTAVGFFVQTGARDEAPAVAGVSHFLEHMLFKGTPRRSADDVNREFDEMGADYNAYTSEENTVYYASVLPEYQTSAVELLADILRPALREEDFNTEKQVIIEEIRMYEDSPPFGADERIKALHFGEHPLSKSVLGTAQSITDLPVSAMRSYFECRYSPGNIVLAAAGKVDFDKLVRDAEGFTKAWRPMQVSRETPRASGQGQFELMVKEAATQQYILQMSDGPGSADTDRHASKLLAMILGDDTGSRLYWELVNPGRAEQAQLAHYEYQGTGVFMSYLCCEPELAKENREMLLDVLKQAHDSGITARELAQAKSKRSARLVLSSERSQRRMFALGGNWVSRQDYKSVADELAATEKVTLEEVHAVLQKYSLRTPTTVAVGPLQTW
jgi:predicted Zn-dependent peptidase